MRYMLNDFVLMNRGANGAQLTALDTGMIYDLSTNQTDELLSFLNDQSTAPAANPPAFIRDLISSGVLTAGQFTHVPDKMNIIDIQHLKSGNAEFALNRVFLEITTGCSLDCKFCSPTDNTAKSSCFCSTWPYAPEEYDLDSLLHQLIGLGMKQLAIIGGDPFTNFPMLQKVIKYINRCSPEIMVAIYSNCSMLDNEKIEFLSNYQNIVICAELVGYDKDSYIQASGVDAFSDVVDNLNKLCDQSCNVIGYFLMSKYTEHGTFPITRIPIMPIYLFNSPEYQINSSLALYDHTARQQKVSLVNYQQLREFNQCLYGQVFIAGDQTVYPCPSLRDFAIGNLKTDELFEIFTNREYIKFWELPMSSVQPCNKCKYNVSCFSCRAVEYSATGDLNKTSYCQIAKELTVNE